MPSGLASWNPMTARPTLRAAVGPFDVDRADNFQITSLLVTGSGYLFMVDLNGGLHVVSLNDPDLAPSRLPMPGGAKVISMTLLDKDDDQVALLTAFKGRHELFVADGLKGTPLLGSPCRSYTTITDWSPSPDGTRSLLLAAGESDDEIGGGAAVVVDVITRNCRLVRRVTSGLTRFTPRHMTRHGAKVVMSNVYYRRPGLLSLDARSGKVTDAVGAFNASADRLEKDVGRTSVFGQGAFDEAGNLYIAADSEKCQTDERSPNYCVLLITPEGATRRLLPNDDDDRWASEANVRVDAVTLTPTGLVVSWRVLGAARKYFAVVEEYDMVQ